MLLSNSHTSRNLMPTIRYCKVNAKTGNGLPPFPTSKHQSHLPGMEEGERDRVLPTLSLAPRASLTLIGKLIHSGPKGVREAQSWSSDAESGLRPAGQDSSWGVGPSGYGRQGWAKQTPWAQRQRKDFSSLSLGNLPTSCPLPGAFLG